MFKCYGQIVSHLQHPSEYRRQKCQSSLDLLISEIDGFVTSFLRLASDTRAIIELALAIALLFRFLVQSDSSFTDPRLLNFLHFEKESLIEHDAIAELQTKLLGYIKILLSGSRQQINSEVKKPTIKIINIFSPPFKQTSNSLDDC
jgi:hypothetical protein